MTFHTQTTHDWSVTPELAMMLCGPRPTRRLFSFWHKEPQGRLGRRWFCRPE